MPEREHGLQTPYRAGAVGGQRPKDHDCTIVPEAPNCVWGTDATQVRTRDEGAVTAFVAVDHFVGDAVGIHASRPGTRFEALGPIHQNTTARWPKTSLQAWSCGATTARST